MNEEQISVNILLIVLFVANIIALVINQYSRKEREKDDIEWSKKIKDTDLQFKKQYQERLEELEKFYKNGELEDIVDHMKIKYGETKLEYDKTYPEANFFKKTKLKIQEERQNKELKKIESKYK